MREILFRGKRVDNGEWIYGYLVKSNEKYYIYYEMPDEMCQTGNWLWYKEVIPETVGQYTGLTDKNGTKIFEGDIIKSDNGRINAISVVRYGKFEPLMFYDLLEKYVRSRPKEKIYGLFSKSIKGEEMLLSDLPRLKEVIGNIHDNPELLKEREG